MHWLFMVVELNTSPLPGLDGVWPKANGSTAAAAVNKIIVDKQRSRIFLLLAIS
jgi:hypothetical protein